MLDNLKVATKLNHSSVEKVLISQLKNLKTKEEYAILLNKLYSFFQSVEIKVHQHINENLLPDINKRTHVANLKQDLDNLNTNAMDKENLFAEKINSISYAFGVLYVMEGSTLGGQIIASMLKKQLVNLDDNSLNYFSSYREKTPEMWKNFKDNFENIAFHINEKEMITGAKDTFENLNAWLTKN